MNGIVYSKFQNLQLHMSLLKKVLHHYVVLIKTTDKYIEIMDPADGEFHKIDHEEFKKQWTGVLVLITPGEKFTS